MPADSAPGPFVYLVGEHGPEVWMPTKPAQVIGHRDLLKPDDEQPPTT